MCKISVSNCFSNLENKVLLKTNLSQGFVSSQFIGFYFLVQLNKPSNVDFSITMHHKTYQFTSLKVNLLRNAHGFHIHANLTKERNVRWLILVWEIISSVSIPTKKSPHRVSKLRVFPSHSPVWTRQERDAPREQRSLPDLRVLRRTKIRAVIQH